MCLHVHIQSIPLRWPKPYHRPPHATGSHGKYKYYTGAVCILTAESIDLHWSECIHSIMQVYRVRMHKWCMPTGMKFRAVRVKFTRITFLCKEVSHAALFTHVSVTRI
jgi:uncharacterized Fe-S cluster protein YjdI